MTENTAMNSGVVENSNGRVKFPLMEPAPSKRSSQIEEYLEFHHGPGAQHIALLSDDIVQTMRALRATASTSSIPRTPTTRRWKTESATLDVDRQSLRELGILVDQDKWGTMFQVFSKPLHGRPTAFMEIIQRKGARGFGEEILRPSLKRLSVSRRCAETSRTFPHPTDYTDSYLN